LERVPPTTITWESEEGGAVVQHDTVIPRLQQLYAYYERISDYFSDPGYYRFNGRPVVLIREPERLYAENSAAVYQGIREAVRQHCGEEIYLIAQQQAWTPPARFHYFFMLGKVDAVTMRNMCNVGGGNWERTYYLPQMTNENFKYNREYIWEHYGIDFVPSVAPSYNYYPLSATSYGEPQVPKDPEQFKKYCSVAKMNLGKQRMVIIDGFNNWETDSGIEPTEEGYGNGYGTLYLELVKQQFKK
jgi:hypothetical protein